MVISYFCLSLYFSKLKFTYLAVAGSFLQSANTNFVIIRGGASYPSGILVGQGLITQVYDNFSSPVNRNTTGYYSQFSCLNSLSFENINASKFQITTNIMSSYVNGTSSVIGFYLQNFQSGVSKLYRFYVFGIILNDGFFTYQSSKSIRMSIMYFGSDSHYSS